MYLQRGRNRNGMEGKGRGGREGREREVKVWILIAKCSLPYWCTVSEWALSSFFNGTSAQYRLCSAILLKLQRKMLMYSNRNRGITVLYFSPITIGRSASPCLYAANCDVEFRPTSPNPTNESTPSPHIVCHRPEIVSTRQLWPRTAEAFGSWNFVSSQVRNNPERLSK